MESDLRSDRLRADRTLVVTVAGASMAPTLPPGTSVLVAARAVPSLPPAPGDVVLLAATPEPIVHRVLHVTGSDSDGSVLHRGDAGGGIGIAPVSAVLGRVVAVLAPTSGPAPSLASLSPCLRRSFARTRRTVLVGAVLMRLGVRRRHLPAWAQRAATRFLS